MTDPETVRSFLKEKLPGSEIQVYDMTGTRDHFEIEIVWDKFEGMALLERHRKIHDALEPLMREAIHAVRLKTLTPTQKQNRNTHAKK